MSSTSIHAEDLDGRETPPAPEPEEATEAAPTTPDEGRHVQEEDDNLHQMELESRPNTVEAYQMASLAEGESQGGHSSSDLNNESSPELRIGPPSGKDRGYAWVVVVSVCLVNTIVAGYVKSFGILYILILESFPEASGSAAGLILGLLVGCRGLLSPVMGALTVLTGARLCVIIGTLLVSGGLLAAVPAESIMHIAFTLGALVGLGLCMSETPGYLAVTDYFDERRSIANGIRASGNALGGMLFSPLIVVLHQHFGLRGALILLAGIMSHMVVLGLLMRPFQLHRNFVQAMYWKSAGHRSGYEEIPSSSETPKKKKPLDFKYLKNPDYLVYLVMVLCVTVALPNALLYTPVYGKSIGLNAYENSVITSYTSGCDFVMRLFCGWITGLNLFKVRNGLVTGLLVGGVGCLVMPLCSSMWQLFGVATCISFCMAFFWTLINVLLADQFGGDAMASTWGFFRMTQGIGSFMYPSLIGFVMDFSGGLASPFLLMGSMLIIGGSIFGLQPLVAQACRNRNES